ncbi:hypothetical protein [Romboutsia sp.]|uniref:hypothetical protein n=1 Tax=Romboutsia sp. TaxID=1965302 RepID=UPI002C1D86FD|nr:hypothetical protein [Romboutsia sp.]HSQ87875.1 hypothetical protein [Romboutsia sp.]
MKKANYYVLVSIILIAMSCIMFFIHYMIFGQAVNTAYYSLMNLCFIPINSLVVTIILERIIDHKAKEERVNKLNMLVGIFFTEVGCKLMHLIINADKEAKNSITCFDNLDKIGFDLLKHEYKIDIKEIDLEALKTILIDNSSLLINLISNENLLQHEIFTDLLMSVVHLRDELVFMENNETNDIDITHLENDIMRVYKNITIQWIHYLEYLNKFYPFLYNNAIRINPFKFK